MKEVITEEANGDESKSNLGATATTTASDTIESTSLTAGALVASTNLLNLIESTTTLAGNHNLPKKDTTISVLIYTNTNTYL